MTADASKRAAARAAADLVRSGMRLGLGTGSTFTHVLDRLAERIRDEDLDILGVPTSESTAQRARELEIPLTELDAVDELDLAIDGADEVDSAKNLIKGGGGALVREKIVAAAARELVIVVDSTKVVDRLGTTFRLPVEVMRFGARHAARRLERLDLRSELRTRGDAPFVTDNGNWIFDCEILGRPDAAELECRINAIAGVVDNGLFVGMTGDVFIGESDGTVRRIP